MIAIIGRGNVATHLYKALKDKTEIQLVNPHTLEGMPEHPDIILISVSDNAIEEIIKNLSPTDAIIAHTAGSIPMEVLKGISVNIGVFYPLQTFTKGVDLNYSDIPVFVEGSNPDVTKKLKNVAALFSNDVRKADSHTRKQLHLASVFACNFTNAMAIVSENLLKNSGIDFSVLQPLMKQTVDKLKILSPTEAQTGPAIRKDTKVIETHLNMLSDNPQYGELYKLITDIIQNG